MSPNGSEGDVLGELRESESRVLKAAGEVQGTLEAFTTVGPFIDLGFEASVGASEVVAIKVFTNEDRDDLSVEYAPLDVDLIRTAVRLRDSGQWLPSSLTYRELRGRLRKAGGSFI